MFNYLVIFYISYAINCNYLTSVKLFSLTPKYTSFDLASSMVVLNDDCKMQLFNFQPIKDFVLWNRFYGIWKVYNLMLKPKSIVILSSVILSSADFKGQFHGSVDDSRRQGHLKFKFRPDFCQSRFVLWVC